ncbi:unnamed protein product [Caretta caretta]
MRRLSSPTPALWEADRGAALTSGGEWRRKAKSDRIKGYTRSSAASEAIPHGALGCAGSLPILYRPTASCRAGQGGILGVKMFKQRCSCWTLNKQRPHSKVKNVQRGNKSLHADAQARGFV